VSQSLQLDTLWYTRCPVPTGLGIAIQKGWLKEAFNVQKTEIKSLRESNDQAVRELAFRPYLTKLITAAHREAETAKAHRG